MSEIELNDPQAAGEFDEEMEDDVSRVKKEAKTRKGRGLGNLKKMDGNFDAVESSSQQIGPQKSVEGYILFVTGIHEEASEEDINDKFSEYGKIKTMHLNMDRRTGFLKGYALIEYKTKEEAQQTLTQLNGTTLLDQKVAIDWAFLEGPQSRVTSRK